MDSFADIMNKPDNRYDPPNKGHNMSLERQDKVFLLALKNWNTDLMDEAINKNPDRIIMSRIRIDCVCHQDKQFLEFTDAMSWDWPSEKGVTETCEAAEAAIEKKHRSALSRTDITIDWWHREPFYEHTMHLYSNFNGTGIVRHKEGEGSRQVKDYFMTMYAFFSKLKT